MSLISFNWDVYSKTTDVYTSLQARNKHKLFQKLVAIYVLKLIWYILRPHNLDNTSQYS